MFDAGANADAPIRILHVDDEPAIPELFAAYLERADREFDLTAATSAATGCDRLRAETFDCVVSDYQMPGADGLQFLESIRAEDPDIPFVLFTGKGSEEIASDAITAGVTDYLQKGGAETYSILRNRIVNVVDRYRMQANLDRTRRQYRTLVEHSTDITTVVDAVGVIRYQSPSIAEHLGYDQDELIGTPSLEHVHPDDEPAVRSAFEATRSDPAATVPEAEYRFRHADGSWRWIASTVTNQLDTVVDGLVVNSRDITDRKRQAARFRALVEESTDAIFVVDETGRIEYVTAAVEHLLGYEPGAMVGRSGFDDIHPEDVERVSARFAEALEEPDGRARATFRYEHADGSWIDLDGRVHDLRDHPAVEGLVVYTRPSRSPAAGSQDLSATDVESDD